MMEPADHRRLVDPVPSTNLSALVGLGLRRTLEKAEFENRPNRDPE
jgi:hypothetical protein